MLFCLLAAWTVEVAAGSALNMPTRLWIRQAGQPDIVLTARYHTRPLADVPYYDIRLSSNNWELELVHHKLYLANRPPEVTCFEVTHGYNFITLGRSLTLGWLDLHPAAGIVLAHPETTVRGLVFDESRGIIGTGWYVSGVALSLGAARRLALGPHWFLFSELKLTGALARVPVASGSADVPNIALHGQLGAGRRF